MQRKMMYRVGGLAVPVVSGLILGLTSPAAHADTYTWDNGGGDYLWSNPVNWSVSAADPATPPTSLDDVSTDVNGGSSVANPVIINTAAAANSVKVSFDYSAALEINADLTVVLGFQVAGKTTVTVTHHAGVVSAGSFTLASRGGGASTYTMTDAAAQLNVTGIFLVGRADAGSNTRFIQQAGSVTLGEIESHPTGGVTYTGTTGYEMSGGTLLVTGTSQFGWKSDVTFTQSGGVAVFEGAVQLDADSSSAPGHGILTLSDAANFNTKSTFAVGSSSALDGKGTIILDGSKTGAGTDLLAEGGIDFNLNSNLVAVIDSAAVATPADMRKIAVTGNATFDAGSLLDVSFDGAATEGTWTLLTATNLSDSGLAFAATVDQDFSDGAGWSFSTDGNMLTVSYSAIPEPTSLALLAMAAGSLTVRRRRPLQRAAGSVA